MLTPANATFFNPPHERLQLAPSVACSHRSTLSTFKAVCLSSEAAHG